MNPRLRRLMERLQRLTDAGRHTPPVSRLVDELSGRVGTVAGELVRAALAGAADTLAHHATRPTCDCPTWQQLGDALAAASLAANQVPNGRMVAVTLGALSAVADLIARGQSDRDPNT